MKALHELEKNERFQKALPSQTEEEINILELSLLEDGCLDPIRTWHNIIIDGHTRYDICHKKGIPFEVEEMDFKDEDEAFLWVLKNQLGRRNLPSFVKCELVLQFEPQLRREAKEKQGQRSDLSNILDNCPKSEGSLNTRESLGELAGVAGKTVDRVKWLLAHADEDTLNALRSDTISVNKAYTNLRGAVPPQKSKQSSPSKIIKFPSATPIEPDWSEGEAPFIDDEEPVEKIDPIQDFDPGPSINDITGILTEIQSNTAHFTDRFMELLSRVLPDDATEENKTAITTTIDNAYTTINNKIKEVFFHEH